MPSIDRRYAAFGASLNTAVGTTQEIVFGCWIGGQVAVPTGSSITTLTYHATAIQGGTYLPLYDAAGSAVAQTVTAGRVYAMPEAVFGCAFLKIVVNAAGSVEIVLKG
jgi:hypothetical protein